MKLSSSNLHSQQFTWLFSHPFLRPWLERELAWGKIWIWSLLIKWEVIISVSHAVTGLASLELTQLLLLQVFIHIYKHLSVLLYNKKQIWNKILWCLEHCWFSDQDLPLSPTESFYGTGSTQPWKLHFVIWSRSGTCWLRETRVDTF